MSLNCLACHILQRTDSDRDIGSRKDSNLKESFATSRYEKMVRNKSSLHVVRRRGNKGHRRLYSAEMVVYGDLDEPKLVRSSGIRRDWSFEDLKKQKDQLRIEDTIKE